MEEPALNGVAGCTMTIFRADYSPDGLLLND
jgi:hypothetical protein